MQEYMSRWWLPKWKYPLMIQMCLKIALKAVRFSSKTVLKSVQNKAIYLCAMMSDEEKQSVIHLAKKLNQKSRYIR